MEGEMINGQEEKADLYSFKGLYPICALLWNIGQVHPYGPHTIT